VIEFFDTPAQANRRALELDERRELGLPPNESDGDPTLAEACDALLAELRTAGKRGKPLSKGGLEYWQRSLRPWREGEHASTPLSLLARKRIRATLRARQLEAPTSARNERAALIAALELAAEDGATFDLGILRIPTIRVAARRRRALTVAELDYLAARVPQVARRLVLLQGTVGNRIEELFLAEPDHFELDAVDEHGRPAPVLFVPAANCKERVAKSIPLTPEEVALAREQLAGTLRLVDASSPTAGCPATPAGSPRAFLTAGVRVYDTGTVLRTAAGPQPWRHTQFDRLVWQPAVRAAAADWRAERGLDEQAATPFEWYVDPADEAVDGRRKASDDGRRTITTHDLRATAVTLMRDLRVPEADCAARVGHADGGDLIRAIYDQGDRARRVARSLAEAAPDGLRAAMGAGA
jgi:integrase